MTITKKYAKRLEKSGKARIERDEKGDVVHTIDNGKPYAIVTRFDIRRVDHYLDGKPGRVQ